MFSTLKFKIPISTNYLGVFGAGNLTTLKRRMHGGVVAPVTLIWVDSQSHMQRGVCRMSPTAGIPWTRNTVACRRRALI